MPDWVAPPIYSAGQLMTEDDLNEISENLRFLKDPAQASVEFTAAADFTSSSTSFVDVTDVTVSITTFGGRIRLFLTGSGSMSATSGIMYLSVTRDGVNIGNTDGFLGLEASNVADTPFNISHQWCDEAADDGAHVYQLRMKVSANTGRIYKGNTANRAFSLKFEAVEVG